MPDNPPPSWRRTHSTPGPDLQLFRVRFDWMVNPRNGHEEKMILLEGADSVQVVGELKSGELLFVQQYRFGVGAYLYELPGGLIDAEEAPLTAAQRELREETGYLAAAWTALGSNPSNPVFMEGHVHHFTARQLEPTGVTQFDAAEDITLVKIKKEEVKKMLLAGKFQHPHTVCALLAYFAADFSTAQ